jgi:hypothetical protein
MRNFKFCKKLGITVEISPQSYKRSLWRDDGNTNPLCQFTRGHTLTTNSLREGKLPNLSLGRDSNSGQFSIVMLSTTGRCSAVRKSSRVDNLAQPETVREMRDANAPTPPVPTDTNDMQSSELV